MTSTLIEIVIERSTNAEGESTYRWSVWNDDQRIEMGRTTHFSASECENSAVEYCWRALGFKPDRVVHQ